MNLIDAKGIFIERNITSNKGFDYDIYEKGLDGLINLSKLKEFFINIY